MLSILFPGKSEYIVPGVIVLAVNLDASNKSIASVPSVATPPVSSLISIEKEQPLLSQDYEERAGGLIPDDY